MSTHVTQPARVFHWRRWISLGGIVALLAYGLSGAYFVGPHQRGVVRWLGRIPPAYRSVPPGLHFALPWPFCRVDTPATTEVRRLYVGLTPDERREIAEGAPTALERSPASDMLSGDVNILKATMIVQYQVYNPSAFLFSTRDPGQLVHDAVRATLVEFLAAMPVDHALTGGKAALSTDVLRVAQQRLDRYDAGVQLVSADLESIEPPRAIIDAFQDVVSAKKDGEKAVDFAVAEANRILPRARGEAVQSREEALAFAQERVSRARGDAARFESVLAEYRRNPHVFRLRMLLQTFELILPRMQVYMLDDANGTNPGRVRIIDTTG